MADKSAFVPVEAVTERKGSAEIEADIDAELFGKKADTKSPAKKKSDTSLNGPSATKPSSSAPAKTSAGKYQYKKSTTYHKSYAYARKKNPYCCELGVSDMSTIIHLETSDVANTERSSFQRIVHILLIVKRWMKYEITKQKAELNTVDDENVMRVFEPRTQTVCVEVKEPLIRRFLSPSWNDTSLAFYLWTLLVCIGCLYNLVTIVIMVFEEARRNYYRLWICFNLAFDGVFLIDLLLQTRREFIDDGVYIKSVKQMLNHRIRSKFFYIDILCILPTDLILYVKPNLSLSRINRLLKCYRLMEFNTITEIRTKFPNLFRIAKLIFICFVIFHWNGCFYFFISVLYDFPKATYNQWIFSYDKIPDPILIMCGVDNWTTENDCSTDIVPPLRIFEDHSNMTEEISKAMLYWENRSRTISFSKFTKQYALSFYWSALTLVTLGEQPSPNDTFQNFFEICDTLMGLVLFAVIVGDVGNMVTTINTKRSNFEEILDGCKSYMIYRKVDQFLQQKAKDYFIYSWSHGGGQVDEEEIAEFLPPRLYGQLAVHIHMETLRRVKLFEECEPNLLYELILKLELRVYSPMDDICRKGDVGTEMYIVKEGAVEVVSDDGSKVFVRLGEGTVFGELSILNIPGNKNGNRRTANVRSVGYSDLYVLSKTDLWEALREYPEAKSSLMEKGKSILAKDNMLEESENEMHVDEDLSVAEKLEAVSQSTCELAIQLNEAECRFQVFAERAKQLLFALEKEVDSELDQMHMMK